MNLKQKERERLRLRRTFNSIADDVLDEYNNKIISKKEMVKILNWCCKMQKHMIGELDKN